MTNFSYYATRSAQGFYEVRQVRFRGKNHPHDVMAVAASPLSLRATYGAYMDPKEVDWSAIQNEDGSFPE